METADSFAIAPAVEHLPPRPPARLDGVRMVTRDSGRCIDLLPSQHSWYLLPNLADCSLLRREARSHAGLLRFTGGAVELEEISGETMILDDWRAALERGTGVITGIGAIGQHTLGLIAELGSSSGRILLPTSMTAATASAARPPDPARDDLTPGATATVVTPDPEDGGVPGDDQAGVATEPLPPDAPVAAIASRIYKLSGLSDELLAELFKVERETFCRWRTGVLTNPRVGNRQRLRLLLTLIEELIEHQVNVRDWLLNSASPERLTPYMLLAQGRIDEVAYLTASLGQDAPAARGPRPAVGDEPDLQFGDDDTWEYDFEDDEP